MISCICLGIGELLAVGIASLFGAIAGRKALASPSCEHAHACTHTCGHETAKPSRYRRWVTRRFEARELARNAWGAPQMRAAVRRSGLAVLAVLLFGVLFAVAVVELDPKHHHGEEEHDHAVAGE